MYIVILANKWQRPTLALALVYLHPASSNSAPVYNMMQFGQNFRHWAQLYSPTRPLQGKKRTGEPLQAILRNIPRRILFSLALAGLFACSAAPPIPAAEMPASTENPASIPQRQPAGNNPEVLQLTTQHWPPYQYEVDGALQGIAVAVVSCVLERMNQPYEIHVLPWARAQADVQAGRADAFFAASQSPAIDQYAVMSWPIAPQVWRWYWLADNNIEPENEDFKTSVPVSAQAGSNMAAWLQREGYDLQSQPATNDQLVNMLLQGHVEAILSNELAVSQTLEDMGLAEDLFASLPSLNKPLGVYFSNTFLAVYPKFLERFNNYIAGCK